MIKELYSLRGVFILFIFLHHMSVFPGGGGMGVAFFFVLGGFAMTLGYHEKVMKPSFAYGSYLGRRMIKFYPLHWLCLLMSLPLVYETFSWLTFGVNAALLHSWVPIGKFYFSYNMVSWYLANTMFFAVVFPFLYRRVGRMNYQSKIICGIMFVLIYIAVVVCVPNSYRGAILYIHPVIRLFDFIVGVFAALFFLKLKEMQNVMQFMASHGRLVKNTVYGAVALLLVETLLLGVRNLQIAALLWPLIIVIVIASSLLAIADISSILKNKWLVLFGEYSFPFFMLHQILIMYVYKFIRPSLCLLTDNRYILQVMLIIVCFTITLISTILIQNYINKPVTQWLTRKIQPSTTVQ